ncbi:hypothetical protein NX059_010537 [Plenodomus lindquistii]|nr:hypothetical protein NX059_010537 [Plenodomus lindquistii]
MGGENSIASSQDQDTATPVASREDIPALIYEDNANGNIYDKEQSYDPFFIDENISSIVTAPEADMKEFDFPVGGSLLGINGEDFMTDSAGSSNANCVDRSLFQSDTGQFPFIQQQGEISSRSDFDVWTNPQFESNVSNDQPEKLVLTIEDPSSDATSAIMGVLVSSKTNSECRRNEQQSDFRHPQ